MSIPPDASLDDQGRVLVRLGPISPTATSRWGEISNRAGTPIVDTMRFDECVLHAVGKRPICLLTTPEALENAAEMARIMDPDDRVFRRVAVVLIAGEAPFTARTVWDIVSDVAGEEEVDATMRAAFAAAERRLQSCEEVDDFHRRRAALTKEETEVLESVCIGKLNKQIAAELGISIRTVEQRRRRVFTKMGVESAVPLARKIGRVEALEGYSVRRDPSHSGGGMMPPLSHRQHASRPAPMASSVSPLADPKAET